MRAWASCCLVVGTWLVSVSAAPLQQGAAGEATIEDEQIRVVWAEKSIEYPPPARMAGVAGIVVLRAELDERGAVASARAISGHRLLIPDCLSNLKKWTFRPNAAHAVVVVYDFQIDKGLCHDVNRTVLIQPHANLVSVVSCTQAQD